MSKLGEWLAWNINRRFPTLAIHRELEKAKINVADNQKWAFKEAQRIVRGFDPYWDLYDKNVLVIGTGVGGKLPIYLEAGVKSVTGIDITPESVCISYRHMQEISRSTEENRFHFSVADAAKMPFPENNFDAIVSMNVFEHIMGLEQGVLETYRVLKPGGYAFLHFNPYYSPWGPHLENWIHFPWSHLLFSDKTLLRVAAREDAERHLNNRFVKAAQVDWEANQIPGVNKVTLRRFRQLVLDAGFIIRHLRLLPVGYEYLRQDQSLLKQIAYWALHYATVIPYLQEIIVTKMVYVLIKPDGE